MSLFGSLYSSAGGLLAQTQSTQFISENIANATTVGFKRSEAAFSDLVEGIGRSSQNDAAGGVRVSRLQRIDSQGAIQQSSSNTDVAVNGNGLFAVKPIANSEAQFSYTRNGQFGEDANGFLRNSAGFILYGALVTDQNTPPDVSTPESLLPIDVTAFDEAAQPTSLLELSINLDATEDTIDPSVAFPPQQLPVNNLPATETRTFSIVDATGVERDVRFEYRKVVGPSAHFSSQFGQDIELDDAIVDANGPTSNILNNDAFSLTVGGVTETIEFVSTAGATLLPGSNEVLNFQDLRNAIDGFGGGGVVQATLSPGGQLLVQAIDPTATVSLSEVVGTPLSVAGTLNIAPDAGAESTAPDFIFEPEAIITGAGATYPDQDIFPPIDNTTNPNPTHWWELTIATDVTTAGGTVPTQLATGLLNFNGDGSLNTTRDPFGNPTNGIIDLSALGIDFDTTVVGEESGFQVDIGRTTQFASDTAVIFSEHDGAPIGQRTGISFTSDGFVSASYSNGQVLQLYRVPIVTFNNVNGLEARSGTIFVESEDSGVATFQGANEGGAGFLQTSSLEQSNVDLANEFGHLIVSQRAYGLNSQVIQAIDEMTEGLSRLII